MTRDDPQNQVHFKTLKRVLMWMTMTKNQLSEIYPEMILCLASSSSSDSPDLSVKKIIYRYLRHCATSRSECILTALDLVMKDCLDPVREELRGLALKCLCAFRLAPLWEQPTPDSHPDCLSVLRQALDRDPAPHVRKIAALGLAKVHRWGFPKVAVEPSWLENTLVDECPQVLVNGLLCLNEITPGGLDMTPDLCHMLLSRWDELQGLHWCQIHVLSLLLKATTRSTTTCRIARDLLSPEWTGGSRSNVALLSATISVMIHFEALACLSDFPLEPFLELMLSTPEDDEPELAYFIFSQIWICLVAREQQQQQRAISSLVDDNQREGRLDEGSRSWFSNEHEWKRFYIRYQEPTYLSIVKIQILGSIVQPHAVFPILRHLHGVLYDGSRLCSSTSGDFPPTDSIPPHLYVDTVRHLELQRKVTLLNTLLLMSRRFAAAQTFVESLLLETLVHAATARASSSSSSLPLSSSSLVTIKVLKTYLRLQEPTFDFQKTYVNELLSPLCQRCLQCTENLTHQQSRGTGITRMTMVKLLASAQRSLLWSIRSFVLKSRTDTSVPDPDFFVSQLLPWIEQAPALHASVQLELLSTVLTCFLEFPVVFQTSMRTLFHQLMPNRFFECIKPSTSNISTDVTDRAFFYYRLLRSTSRVSMNRSCRTSDEDSRPTKINDMKQVVRSDGGKEHTSFSPEHDHLAQRCPEECMDSLFVLSSWPLD